jgi:ABC-2 type transport system ATP-binding protein
VSVAAIELVHLGKSYGDLPAIRDLSLTIREGEVYGLLGPNGAGKSTTIRLILGMQRPDHGEVLVRGVRTLGGETAVKRQIGYLPDVPIFQDHVTGRELLTFVASVHGLDGASAARRTDALLGLLGLTDAAEDFASTYSTGMKKKLALACALVHEPPILVLDEPTNALDPAAAKQVRDCVADYARRGRTVLLSTHLLDMAQRICHRVGILHHGILLADGSVADLLEKKQGARDLEEVFLQLTTEAAG